MNKVFGHVVDGHLRVELAISRHEPTVPVVYVELREEEERLVLATLDPLAAMATADMAKLEELLRELTDAARRAIGGYSVGMRQRLGIGQANAQPARRALPQRELPTSCSTEGQAPVENVGGRYVTRICKRCNSFFGHRYEGGTVSMLRTRIDGRSGPGPNRSGSGPRSRAGDQRR